MLELSAPQPLAYHRSVLGHVRRTDERAWRSLVPAVQDRPASGTTPAAPGGSDPQLADELLRNTYRLDPAGHPEVHAATRRAADALGLTGPVTLYQAQGGSTANAFLLHQPDHAVIVFEGRLLEVLDTDELTAICGHELAHRLLWTVDGGAYLGVDRLLDAAAGDGRTPAVYLETARRWSMACELFADRGALVACGDLATTVRALLKVSTGLSGVDPAAYLRQAEEVDLSTGSRAASHPEGVARAWALRRWLDGADAETIVTGPLDVENPDLPDAVALRELSAEVAAHAVRAEGLRTDAVAGHATGFLDPPPAGVVPPPTLGLPRLDGPWAPRPVDGAPIPAVRELAAPTRAYLCYLLLDLATVDPDTGDAGLVAAMALARRAGIGAAFDDLADDELGWSDARRRKLAAAADKAVPDPAGTDTTGAPSGPA